MFDFFELRTDVSRLHDKQVNEPIICKADNLCEHGLQRKAFCEMIKLVKVIVPKSAMWSDGSLAFSKLLTPLVTKL